MNKAEVDILERRIRENYEKDMAAIRRVQKMLSENGSSPVKSAIESKAAAGADDAEADDQSLVGNIEAIFLSDLKKNWTVPKIERRLLESGVTLKAKNPKPSIAGAIKRLMKRGVIRLVKKGGGKIPHIYRGAEQKDAGSET